MSWCRPLVGPPAALALAAMLIPTASLAQDFRIGGTGGALATMQMLADDYRRIEPEVKITVMPSLGSGGGIKALLAGAIQIAVSSRELKPSETSQGAHGDLLGRTPFVFAVSPAARIDAITVKDLVEIYSGRTMHWPDGTRIHLVLRPVGDSDSDMVKGISPEVRQAKLLAESRRGMLFAVTDQEAAENLEKISGAFGSSTLAQIVTEKRAIKPLRFNGVEPNAETVADGSYPYFKPLFIVTGPKTPAAAQRFAAFMRSAAGRKILAQSGYGPP
jgi:phosphate transport system substrate-binding protein